MTENRTPNSELRILTDCKQLVFYTIDLINAYPEFKFTINQQILRSAVSVGSNIAEGNSKSPKDFKRFLRIAKGSLEEYKFQYSLYEENEEKVHDLLDKISATIYKLQNRLSVIGNRESD